MRSQFVNLGLVYALILQSGLVASVTAQDNYSLGPDSQVQAGVPKGEVTKYTWTSKIFPGTVRDYWVYVPKQYDGSKPACVMVFQDGGGYADLNGGSRIPIVFDNLIHKGEMPVTVAIMINPGVVPAANADALPRFNRSYEYDAPTAQYGDFLLEEILPEVGKKVRLSTNPDDRAICGASSGGIAAFVAAWTHPTEFHRVMSFIGSFVNLRGGHLFPTLIRKMEPLPLRVYLQDGSNDQDIYAGHWFIGNNDMAAALKFAGYDTTYITGTGGHSGRHMGALLPDALRWLWRDHGKPIKPSIEGRQPLKDIVDLSNDWELVNRGYMMPMSLCADKAGNVYVADRTGAITRLDVDGSTNLHRNDIKGIESIAQLPDGRLVAAIPDHKLIVAFNRTGKPQVVSRGIAAGHLITNANGNVIAVDNLGRVWSIPSKGQRKQIGLVSRDTGGICLSPDQTLFLRTQWSGDFAFSSQIQLDGKLDHEQPFYDLHIPYGYPMSSAHGMAVDSKGWLYVATEAGIQILDQAGRVNMILKNPDGAATSRIVFGGKDRDSLFALVAGGRVYKRKLKVKGVYSFEAPIKPPAPRL